MTNQQKKLSVVPKPIAARSGSSLFRQDNEITGRHADPGQLTDNRGRRFAEELDATDSGDTPGFRREIAELQNERSLLP